jgi:hypothetical protein
MVLIIVDDMRLCHCACIADPAKHQPVTPRNKATRTRRKARY